MKPLDPTLFRRIARAFPWTWAAAAVVLYLGGIVALLSSSSKAADTVSVTVSDLCQTLANSPYPFIERNSDIRFSPLPLTAAPEITTLVQPELTNMPVSAALMPDNRTLLTANYGFIYSLDLTTGSGKKISVDLSHLHNQQFVPTGLAIGPTSGRIFLANYLANNILVGRIANEHIQFDEELTDTALISPENVATTQDEAWIVSANFDGNTATGFARENGGYRHKWTAQIPLAHGIAIMKDMAFVSSLALRKIFVLKLQTGEVIGTFGQPGWNTYCLDLLWPTSIVAHEDMLVITDAHTGGVYRIAFNGRIGKLIDVVGGTVPGLMGLQMPYATTLVGSDLAVLSTFSPKILIIGPAKGEGEGLAVRKIIVQDPPQLEPLAETPKLALGAGWNGYVHLAIPPTTVSGMSVVPSYGAMMEISQHRPIQTGRSFALYTLHLFGNLMYFVESHQVDKGLFLSSPSASFALYITQGRTSCLAKADLPSPPLQTESGFRHRLGTALYEEVERAVLAQLRELDSRRRQDNLLDRTELAQWFKVPVAAIDATLTSEQAKHALDEMTACRADQCPSARRDEIIDEYRKSGSSLLELLLLDMSAHRCISN